MDYNCGEIFNKKNLVFKDGVTDTRLYGHPVVVLFDTVKVGKVFFLKMVSDITMMAKYPGRYMLIPKTPTNGLDKPSLICLDEIYISDEERVPPRGELSEEQYKCMIKQMYEYNAKITNQDPIYAEVLEVLGDIDTYLKAVSF